jgi:hypothetical protein
LAKIAIGHADQPSRLSGGKTPKLLLADHWKQLLSKRTQLPAQIAAVHCEYVVDFGVHTRRANILPIHLAGLITLFAKDREIVRYKKLGNAILASVFWLIKINPRGWHVPTAPSGT